MSKNNCLFKTNCKKIKIRPFSNRKLKISGCLFQALENFRAKKRLATSGQLSPLSVKNNKCFQYQKVFEQINLTHNNSMKSFKEISLRQITLIQMVF